MATAPGLVYEEVARKVVLGLELVDMLSGLPVIRGLKVEAVGLGPPQRITASGFVWLLEGAPKAQNLVVKITSSDLHFRDRTVTLRLPANDDGVTPGQLGKRRLLRPTGLQLPPSGLTAIAGMLIDDATSPAGIADALIRVQLRDLGPKPLTATYTAVSDVRGAFVAAMPNLHRAVTTRASPPAPEGAVVGWLEIRSGGVTRYTEPYDVRPGRLLRVAAPIQLSTLSPAPPP